MNNQLREKIDAAKEKLPLPQLMEALGEGEHAAKSARCPFHIDARPSFSVYQAPGGGWRWNCFAGCGSGDEIDYLEVRDDLSTGEAIREFFRLADEVSEDVDGQENHEQERDWSDFDY